MKQPTRAGENKRKMWALHGKDGGQETRLVDGDTKIRGKGKIKQAYGRKIVWIQIAT